MSDKVRVRYAPSPTGHLHIGNARTALFNYLFARANDGEFIIRIEDTDTKRNVERGEESQLENLEWLGIEWNEGPDKPGNVGPYRQSERGETYQKYAEQLLASGNAYYAFDTPEELEANREEQKANGIAPHYPGTWRGRSQEEIDQARAEGRPETIRFRIPDEGTYAFDDLVKGNIEFEASTVGGDFVIIKNDGMPTYNYAVVIDDHLMEISHVLRGDDHIANTPKQMMIYEALGWEHPRFGHMSLINNAETGKKLSKRDESIIQFIEQYRDLGYLPDAMFNFITLLGWSPKGEEEIFTKEEFIEIFDASRLSKSPANFDEKKLEWINNQYVKAKDLEEVVELALPHLIQAGKLPKDLSDEQKAWAQKLVSLYKDEMSFGAEIVELSEMFFETDLHLDDQAKEVLAEEDVDIVLTTIKAKFADIDQADFTEKNIMAVVKETQKETGLKGKKLYMPIRVAVSGQNHGPSLGLTIEVLGKERVLRHLDEALELITK